MTVVCANPGRYSYGKGCRCRGCRDAKAEYYRMRYSRKIPAAQFVAVLTDLHTRGESLRRMAEVTGCSPATIAKLLTGKQAFVWRRTADKLRKVVVLLPSQKEAS